MSVRTLSYLPFFLSSPPTSGAQEPLYIVGGFIIGGFINGGFIIGGFIIGRVWHINDFVGVGVEPQVYDYSPGVKIRVVRHFDQAD